MRKVRLNFFGGTYGIAYLCQNMINFGAVDFSVALKKWEFSFDAQCGSQPSLAMIPLLLIKSIIHKVCKMVSKVQRLDYISKAFTFCSQICLNPCWHYTVWTISMLSMIVVNSVQAHKKLFENGGADFILHNFRHQPQKSCKSWWGGGGGGGLQQGWCFFFRPQNFFQTRGRGIFVHHQPL